MSRLGLSEALVRRLVSGQFPQYSATPLRLIEPGGWDNRSFRLGDELVVRLPSAASYASQIAREAAAFAALAGQLPLAMTTRVHLGQPGEGYPFVWAINRWVPGNPAGSVKVSPQFGAQCGQFLAKLHSLKPAAELPPGPGNFHRGGPLETYASEVDQALDLLGASPLRASLARQWERALARPHSAALCWVHGDVFPWNLLVDASGDLCGVIDWGLVATGDPACDYAIGWTCFSPAHRGDLRRASGVDQACWDRARGWSLWKALTLFTGVNGGTPADIAASQAVLERIAQDQD